MLMTKHRLGKAPVDFVQTDLLSGLHGLRRRIDVLLFNPPYVPTPEDEVWTPAADTKRIIFASWAGGERGRVVIDRVLDQLDVRKDHRFEGGESH
jgi:release factor glutamine methyltransferase